MFTHEKLIVYQRSIEWLALSTKINQELPVGNGELANQLKRATLSIVLNIAEGSGKVTKVDKQRFFAIARGSALECAAILDVINVLELVSSVHINSSREMLLEIVSMLSVLCRK